MSMLLEVKNLTKIYTVGLFRRKEIVAVKDVSFNVRLKEFLSLVGESGSGKTTTAKIILKLIKPTSGTILFERRNIADIKTLEEKREYWSKVHGIFQDPYASYNPLHKVDRVLEQVFTLMKGSNFDKKSIIKEALREVGLRPGEILGKYPHELSGGQRQRIMIARCYILKPKLILADEPISMIDASTRAGVLQLFSKLRDEHDTAIIFITHDLGLAYYVSDKILIMYKGSIVESGPPDEIMENPKFWYTKRLIKDVPLLYRKWDGF